MKTTVLFAASLALLAPGVRADEMPWAKDWESAQKAAKASKKLLMLDFFTEW